MFHLKFLWLSIVTSFKLALALRGIFFLTILLIILKQTLFLIAWNFFFEKYKVIQGWRFDDMLFMYGSICFATGFNEAFFNGLKELPRIIETNQLDTFLLQPKNVVLNVAMSKGDMSSLGEIITGIIFIFYSGHMIKAFPVILFILTICILFIFSLYLYLSCIAFFMRNAYEFIRELSLNALIVASQPNAAYSGAFKIFTLTILPVAFLGYFPVEHLRTGLWRYLFLSLFGTMTFFGIACWLFRLGLKRYESGNLIVYRH